jgi:hypothetical protein
MQFETNASITNNLSIDNEYFLEIKQINKNICNYIESFFLFTNEDTMMQEIKAEKCFRDLIPIIDSALNYINRNINFLPHKINNINSYITYLNYLKIFSYGVYDKISSKRVNEEEYYLASIPNEDMAFYDYEKIKYIKFSKINLSSKDMDTLNILLRNLMKSSLKKSSVFPKNTNLRNM